VDSSEMAFKTASLMAFREGFDRAKPILLEPIMKVEVEAPGEFQGSVVGLINQRRGMVLETGTEDGAFIGIAEVPLNTMFGFATDLRSSTQGKGTFTMEFAKYAQLPKTDQEELIKQQKEKSAA
jgi:elongation factor G